MGYIFIFDRVFGLKTSDHLKYKPLGANMIHSDRKPDFWQGFRFISWAKIRPFSTEISKQNWIKNDANYARLSVKKEFLGEEGAPED